MRSVIYILALSLFCSGQALAEEFYVGEINARGLMQFDRFAKHQDDVTYSDEQVQKLKDIKQDVEIKVYFGQWCHDSQREVPRLVRLFEQVNQDNYKLWYYGVDLKKSDPLGLAKADNLRRTPTVILYKNGEEVGRILEVPRMDWATDISTLLQ